MRELWNLHDHVPDIRLLLELQQNLLLALRPPEIPHGIPMPAAHVLQRLRARHVPPARRDEEARIGIRVLGVAVVRIEIVEDGVGDIHRDAAEVVHHPAETAQPDPGVVIDVDIEVLLNRGTGQWHRAKTRRGVDLPHACAGDRDPEIPRNGEHRHPVVHRIDADDDHGLCERVSLELLIVVAAQQEDVDAVRAKEILDRRGLRLDGQPGLDLVRALDVTVDGICLVSHPQQRGQQQDAENQKRASYSSPGQTAVPQSSRGLHTYEAFASVAAVR